MLARKVETAKKRWRVQWQAIKKWGQPGFIEMQGKHLLENKYLLLHTYTWRSNRKAEIRGVNTGKLFRVILQSYFSYLFYIFSYLFLEVSQLAGYVQCQQQRIWENKITKYQGWMLPLLIHFTDNHILHRPSIPKTKNLRTAQCWP